MPPIAKVYEALGAIGDGRVQIDDARHASVTSSDGAKVYTVESSENGAEISSNDNASFWQGYLGYPAIAVMIARGLIHADETAGRALAGVPWKQLNTRYKNDYERTLEDVMRQAEERGFDPAAIRAAANEVLEAVRALAPRQGPHRRPPRAKSR